MKTFFGRFFAALLGTMVGIPLLILILTFLIGFIAQSLNKPQPIRQNTVLQVNLEQYVPELTNNVNATIQDFDQNDILGVHDMVRLIEMAKEDDKIQGIYLNSSIASTGGIVKVDLIREALSNFKSSGKFVVAYSKYYSQLAYYLSSVADQVYLNPLGLVDLKGFGGTIFFYKNMLDKAGVEMQVFYAGEYKGASEPYRRTNLSPENRKQLQVYVGELYQNLLEEISTDRNLTTAQLRQIIDNYEGGSATTALSSGLVDALYYEDQVKDYMREQMDIAEDKKIKLVSLERYGQANKKKSSLFASNKIAVLYAEGTILDGELENGVITDGFYGEAIESILKDDKVKAVVLRVNSPGGSAMASENIWRGMSLLKEKGIPIVVSMGDYAASGGYYISMASDKIYAQKNTLTGSIGVVRQFPNLEELMSDKIGITVDTVSTGKFSTGFNTYIPLSEAEKNYLKRETDNMYQIFLKRVADNRNMSIAAVDSVARGRVWMAAQAVDKGLVDEIGTLQDAISHAAEMAKLEDYAISNYPKVKDPLSQLISQFMDVDVESAQAASIETQLGEWYQHFEVLKNIKETQGIQARLPFELVLE